MRRSSPLKDSLVGIFRYIFSLGWDLLEVPALLLDMGCIFLVLFPVLALIGMYVVRYYLL